MYHISLKGKNITVVNRRYTITSAPDFHMIRKHWTQEDLQVITVQCTLSALRLQFHEFLESYESRNEFQQFTYIPSVNTVIHHVYFEQLGVNWFHWLVLLHTLFEIRILTGMIHQTLSILYVLITLNKANTLLILLMPSSRTSFKLSLFEVLGCVCASLV